MSASLYLCGTISNKICSRCNIISYCSKECQKKDWVYHKTICKASSVNPNLSYTQQKNNRDMCFNTAFNMDSQKFIIESIQHSQNIKLFSSWIEKENTYINSLSSNHSNTSISSCIYSEYLITSINELCKNYNWSKITAETILYQEACRTRMKSNYVYPSARYYCLKKSSDYKGMGCRPCVSLLSHLCCPINATTSDCPSLYHIKLHLANREDDQDRHKYIDNEWNTIQLTNLADPIKILKNNANSFSSILYSLNIFSVVQNYSFNHGLSLLQYPTLVSDSPLYVVIQSYGRHYSLCDWLEGKVKNSFFESFK